MNGSYRYFFVIIRVGEAHHHHRIPFISIKMPIAHEIQSFYSTRGFVTKSWINDLIAFCCGGKWIEDKLRYKAYYFPSEEGLNHFLFLLRVGHN